jgi:hypothetical protein
MRSAMALFAALRRDPDLQGISFSQLMTFTQLLSPLKNNIILCQPITVSTTDPPKCPVDGMALALNMMSLVLGGQRNEQQGLPK